MRERWQFFVEAFKRATSRPKEHEHTGHFYLKLVFAVVLVVALLFGVLAPVFHVIETWVVGITAGIALALFLYWIFFEAYFAIWGDERAKAKGLASELEVAREGLVPRIEILEECEDWNYKDGIRAQVQIKNRSDVTLRFRAQLTDITPRPYLPGLQLPVNLQIAGEPEGTSEGVLLGRGDGLIEVFVLRRDDKGHLHLWIYGATCPISVTKFAYTVVVAVQAGAGKSVSRRFLLVGFDSDSLSLAALPEPATAPGIAGPASAVPNVRRPRQPGRRLCLLALMLFNRVWRALMNRTRSPRPRDGSS